MSVVIEFDATELEREWKDVGMRALNAGVANAVREACAQGAVEAVNTRIYEDRTAQLTASIHGDGYFVLTAEGAEGQILAGEDYASYVNDWEGRQISDGFMDRAGIKAEAVLTAELDVAAHDAETAMNR